MKICHFSDSHNVNLDLNSLIPDDIDMVIFTGDMSYRGTDRELAGFVEQMRPIAARVQYVIGTVGNHELGCEGHEDKWRDALSAIGVKLLFHESIEIEGIKIFGSPFTPYFCNWAYNYHAKDANKLWSAIPEDTQMLITHGPPYGILDWCPNGNVGSYHLLDRIKQLPNLTHMLFGHLHPSYGTIEISGVKYYNSSLMNDAYRRVNLPQIFEIVV